MIFVVEHTNHRSLYFSIEGMLYHFPAPALKLPMCSPKGTNESQCTPMDSLIKYTINTG